ncbi:glycosyltransferase family 4 protein [bacterium]|nr:glycosyltransferase family 4 protein [candidate division CSSED10-310 bacterium]
MAPETGNDLLKILIGTPCLLKGGTEMHILEVIKILVRAGHGVSVCCYYESDKRMVSAASRTGARIIRLNLKRSGRFRNIHRMPLLVSALSGVLRREKPDVFHVHYLAPGLLAVLTGRIMRVPVVAATLHTPGHVYGKNLPLLRLAGKHLCHLFFCVSGSSQTGVFGEEIPFSVERYRSGSRQFTIYNGVDLEEISRFQSSADAKALRARHGIADGPVIGVVARLSREKGHDILLRAFQQVVKIRTDAELLVVGDGENRDTLHGLARELGIDNRIVWTGELNRAGVLEAYAVMDLAVVPSRFEGFGLSACEAMSFARPVIASNVDGLRDIIDPGRTGFLVPPCDPDALATCILEVLQHPEKMKDVGFNARRRVESRFSLDRFQREWLSVYTTIGQR